ncbi:uncharacterized protein LOC116845350 isoform X2 [Odontomachus brunneus]|uniref:uncharacterized protein LOC116845350 isoform X2 n=1 Tax=Odontomachus brunneus TaxID=486640 RepID=UPI0013F2A591|nr:uncharacterized protein LOC116845350 isoform X2 [Odontomachus brunneus]
MDPLEGDKKDIYRDSKLPGIGRGNMTWVQTDNVGLRRPHITSSNQSLDSVASRSTEYGSEQTPGRKQSKLSVNAAVFIPKFPKSVQDRIDAARAAPPNINPGPGLIEDNTSDISLQQCLDIQESQANSCNNFNTNYEYQNYSDGKEREVDTNVSDFNRTIFELERIICTITRSPGEFDNLVPSFVNNIRREGNICYLRIFVTSIINWSIDESNFRYNGARFCTYFDDTSESEEQLLFRDILHYSCLLETRMQEFVWQRVSDDSYDQKKCHGLILFLAELVAQMDETFAFTLGGLLIEFITKILKKPTSNIAKYIYQALKLAGQRLEKDKSKSVELKNMMQTLTEFANRGQQNTSVGNTAHRMQESRNENWGRDPSHSDSFRTNSTLYQMQQVSNEPSASNYAPAFNSSKTSTVVSQSDDALVYGPDGQIILTEEESKFLHDHIEQDALDDYIDYNYDDEIATAYEEFLRDKSK